jgi:hypothetical protein
MLHAIPKMLLFPQGIIASGLPHLTSFQPSRPTDRAKLTKASDSETISQSIQYCYFLESRLRRFIAMPEDKEPKRHCWECLRRSLVCDFRKPKCNRCTASGTECPGYGDKKPIRIKWLPPGKAKSRDRKPKGSPSGQTVKATTDVSLTRKCEGMIHPEPATDLHAMVGAVQYCK